MYPGTATNKMIPMRKTRVLHFRKKGQGDNSVTAERLIPAVNISETNEEYLIVIAAPGLRRENFRIEISQSVITISAKKEITALSCVNDRCEYDYTDWTRAFSLPEDADGLFAHAQYQNGELFIYIPRNSTSEKQANVTIYVY